MCLFTPFEPTPEPERDPAPEIVLAHLTASDIRCPKCKLRHDIGLTEDDMWCGCNTHIVIIFLPCLYGLSV
jgi:hypothetical protein